MSIVDETRALVDRIVESKEQRRALVQQIRNDVSEFRAQTTQALQETAQELREKTEALRERISDFHLARRDMARQLAGFLGGAKEQRTADVSNMMSGLGAASEERRSEAGSMLRERASQRAQIREMWLGRGRPVPILFSAPKGEQAPRRPRRRSARQRRGR